MCFWLLDLQSSTGKEPEIVLKFFIMLNPGYGPSIFLKSVIAILEEEHNIFLTTT